MASTACRVAMVILPGLAQAMGVPCAAAQRAAPDSVDIRHGIEVADPFRWLEAMQTPRVLRWARQQDARARAFAAEWPGRDSVRRSIERAASHERYLAPVRRDS